MTKIKTLEMFKKHPDGRTRPVYHEEIVFKLNEIIEALNKLLGENNVNNKR